MMNVKKENKPNDFIHPCFDKRCSLGRIHLPVAPKCNIQCNFCSRKFDCVNESRPGVTSKIMTPEMAYAYYQEQAQKYRLSVAGIAGPGDPLANFEEVKKTFQIFRDRAPHMKFCLSTNGLTGKSYVQSLYALGVSYITVTINAVSPEVASKIYSYVTIDGERKTGPTAMHYFLSQQELSLKAFHEKGFHIKVNFVLIPGVNESQVIPVAQLAQKYGARLMNIIPIIPVAETPFENIMSCSKEKLAYYQAEARKFVPIMTHCTHCRADAVGYL